VNLQERLEQAKEHRRQSRGLPPQVERSTPTETLEAPTGPPTSGAASDLSPDDPVVDLTAPVIDLTTRVPRHAAPAPFAPADDDQSTWSGATTYDRRDDCPACGGPVRLDLEDVVGHVDHMSCDTCGLFFQTAR